MVTVAIGQPQTRGNQMNRYGHLLSQSARVRSRVEHRIWGDIPNLTQANDVFTIDEDGYVVIQNPSKPYRNDYAR
jgi:acyl-coenzyme A synthetase/AMP-(fatty) acid ligase